MNKEATFVDELGEKKKYLIKTVFPKGRLGLGYYETYDLDTDRWVGIKSTKDDALREAESDAKYHLIDAKSRLTGAIWLDDIKNIKGGREQ